MLRIDTASPPISPIGPYEQNQEGGQPSLSSKYQQGYLHEKSLANRRLQNRGDLPNKRTRTRSHLLLQLPGALLL